MIEFTEVTKSFGSRRAVDRVTFSCQPGSVTGFLGPNGAGKSTTMRMLCNLTQPDAGEARVLGRHFREMPNPGREIGVLLDASAQHAGRRGSEVLSLTARTLGVDRSRVGELLSQVGLDSAASKRVGNYSLGMRQRLGIANALVGSPRVLVLDEPANGLDPEGIRWMRSLLRQFADGGGTVLLSSHLLKEVDAVADHLVIIANGRVVSSGTREELLQASGCTVGAPDVDRLANALTAAGLAFQVLGEARLRVEAEALAVSKVALEAHVPLSHLDDQNANALEELFFDLVSDSELAA